MLDQPSRTWRWDSAAGGSPPIRAHRRAVRALLLAVLLDTLEAVPAGAPTAGVLKDVPSLRHTNGGFDTAVKHLLGTKKVGEPQLAEVVDERLKLHATQTDVGDLLHRWGDHDRAESLKLRDLIVTTVAGWERVLADRAERLEKLRLQGNELVIQMRVERAVIAVSTVLSAWRDWILGELQDYSDADVFPELMRQIGMIQDRLAGPSSKEGAIGACPFLAITGGPDRHRRELLQAAARSGGLRTGRLVFHDARTDVGAELVETLQRESGLGDPSAVTFVEQLEAEFHRASSNERPDTSAIALAGLRAAGCGLPGGISEALVEIAAERTFDSAVLVVSFTTDPPAQLRSDAAVYEWDGADGFADRVAFAHARGCDEERARLYAELAHTDLAALRKLARQARPDPQGFLNDALAPFLRFATTSQTASSLTALLLAAGLPGLTEEDLVGLGIEIVELRAMRVAVDDREIADLMPAMSFPARRGSARWRLSPRVFRSLELDTPIVMALARRGHELIARAFCEQSQTGSSGQAWAALDDLGPRSLARAITPARDAAHALTDPTWLERRWERDPQALAADLARAVSALAHPIQGLRLDDDDLRGWPLSLRDFSTLLIDASTSGSEVNGGVFAALHDQAIIALSSASGPVIAPDLASAFARLARERGGRPVMLLSGPDADFPPSHIWAYRSRTVGARSITPLPAEGRTDRFVVVDDAGHPHLLTRRWPELEPINLGLDLGEQITTVGTSNPRMLLLGSTRARVFAIPRSTLAEVAVMSPRILRRPMLVPERAQILAVTSLWAGAEATGAVTIALVSAPATEASDLLVMWSPAGEPSGTISLGTTEIRGLCGGGRQPRLVLWNREKVWAVDAERCLMLAETGEEHISAHERGLLLELVTADRSPIGAIEHVRSNQGSWVGVLGRRGIGYVDSASPTASIVGSRVWDGDEAGSMRAGFDLSDALGADIDRAGLVRRVRLEDGDAAPAEVLPIGSHVLRFVGPHEVAVSGEAEIVQMHVTRNTVADIGRELTPTMPSDLWGDAEAITAAHVDVGAEGGLQVRAYERAGPRTLAARPQRLDALLAISGEHGVGFALLSKDTVQYYGSAVTSRMGTMPPSFGPVKPDWTMPLQGRLVAAATVTDYIVTLCDVGRFHQLGMFDVRTKTYEVVHSTAVGIKGLAASEHCLVFLVDGSFTNAIPLPSHTGITTQTYPWPGSVRRCKIAVSRHGRVAILLRRELRLPGDKITIPLGKPAESVWWSGDRLYLGGARGQPTMIGWTEGAQWLFSEVGPPGSHVVRGVALTDRHSLLDDDDGTYLMWATPDGHRTQRLARRARHSAAVPLEDERDAFLVATADYVERVTWRTLLLP